MFVSSSALWTGHYETDRDVLRRDFCGQVLAAMQVQVEPAASSRACTTLDEMTHGASWEPIPSQQCSDDEEREIEQQDRDHVSNFYESVGRDEASKFMLQRLWNISAGRCLRAHPATAKRMREEHGSLVLEPGLSIYRSREPPPQGGGGGGHWLTGYVWRTQSECRMTTFDARRVMEEITKRGWTEIVMMGDSRTRYGKGDGDCVVFSFTPPKKRGFPERLRAETGGVLEWKKKGRVLPCIPTA